MTTNADNTRRHPESRARGAETNPEPTIRRGTAVIGRRTDREEPRKPFMSCHGDDARRPTVAADASVHNRNSSSATGQM